MHDHSRLYRFFSRHWLLAFLTMGVAFVLFGLVTLDLIHTLGANFDFLARHGLDAVRDGGLRQLAELVISGYAAAAFYLLFKLCEKVLVERLALKNDRGTDT